MRLGHAEIAGARPRIVLAAVAVHVARDHPVLLVAVARVVHAQRLEEGLVQVDMPRLAAGRLDHRAQQHVAGIVVVPTLARREVGLFRLEGIDEFRGAQVAHDRRAGHHPGDICIAAQARGVVEQHAHADLVAARIAGHELRQRIIQRQLAGLRQFQCRRSGELLGDRPDPEDLVGGERHAQFEVGAAAGAAVEHLVAARQQYRHARRGLVAVGVQGARGECRHVLLRWLCGRRLRGGEQQCDQQGRAMHGGAPLESRGMWRAPLSRRQ